MRRMCGHHILHLCIVGVVIADKWTAFSVERDMNVSCSFHASLEKSVSACALSCYHDNRCVSASFSADVGWCQQTENPCCLESTGTAGNWTTFRRKGASCGGRSSPEETCLEDSGSSLQTCFHLAETRLTRKEALDHCLATGGELAEIHSEQQQRAIELYLAEKGGPDEAVLTSGMRFHFQNGTKAITWNFIGGSHPMVYQNWDVDADPPQPYFTASKKCVVLQPDSDYKWHLSSCTKPWTFLCQKVSTTE